MTRLNQGLCALGLVALVSAAACRGSSAPSAPSSPPPLSVAGSWRGTAKDSSGPGSITMQVTQSSTNLSGTVTMTVTDSSTTGRGTLTGTLSGSNITLTITIPAGGFDAPFASCNATVSGNGQASASLITANYSGTNSCSGAITAGELTLNKG